MKVSQKCQYAVRAVFELAKHYGKGPVRICDIAEAQAIPARFLEVILGELKQGGFTESRRGKEGGYMLVREPAGLTARDIIRFVEGPLAPVDCVAGSSRDVCALHEHCVFVPMWRRAQQAVEDVFDGTTFRDLIDEERRMRVAYVPSYTI